MLRFWYLICIIFFAINVNILIDESYDVVYKMVNQTESLQYINCLNLNEIIINKTEINLNEIKNEFNYGLKWIQKYKIDELIPNETIGKISNQTESIDYFIYQDRICFILSDWNDFIKFYNLTLQLKIGQNYFVFNNDTFNFLKIKDLVYSLFNQISVEHKEHPYSSCSRDYSNFKCLNDKIKRIQPLTRYYYRSDEKGSVQLNYQINQTIIDNEIKIIKQCNEIDCKINLLYSIPHHIKSESIKLKSFLIITKLDFYLKLIGLFVLFLNVPIFKLIIEVINSSYLRILMIKILNLINYELINFIFRKIFNKLKSRLKLNRFKIFKLMKSLKRKYLKKNNLVILILLIFLLILFIQSIYNFIQERDYPFNETISVDLIKQELLIIICVPIEEIKSNDYNIYKRPLSELEKDSDDGLNIVLKDIYLEFLNKKIRTKWQLESELIRFYQFQRCFQLRIFLNEPKYQIIFSITKLIIEFNENKFNNSIFILTDNETFNSNSYKNLLSYNFQKRILERSKLNKIRKCKDFNLIDNNCISKSNCIDYCINRKIYNQIKNLTTKNKFIDKNHFTDKEWSHLFIESIDNKIYNKISKKCEDKYLELDPCVDIKFEYQSRINYKDHNKKVIHFNYEVIYHKEDEPSVFKLVLDLLNIQGNLFGLNFCSFSLMILGLFKFTNLKLIKIYKLFIYLICLIGLIYHLWSIYDEIINIKIIFSEYYELVNSIEPPDLIFCFDHTKLIDQNYKLTYQYLDKITSNELREDLIFDKIEYLNDLNKWIKLDNKTDFQDNNLKIKIFYFLDRKCFKIIQKNTKYKRNQFEFIDKTIDVGLILKIFFNRTYLDERIFYFFTKTKNKIQFSKIKELNLKIKSHFKSFNIKHELIERDEFQLIKNPLSSDNDRNDLDKFFNKLINYLNIKLNLVTFKLPINKTNLNLNKELDDNLFIQLYNQKQDQTDFNHLRRHSHNYFEYIYHKPEDFIADLEFSLSFYKKVIVVSNKISLIKLIINLLNVLSFWFDLGILDLNNYFFVLKLLPLKSYKLLIIIRTKLSSII